MIESPCLHLTSLIISSICFAIACFDVIPCSPAILVGCLAFTLATAFVYWLHASQACVGTEGQPKSSSNVNLKTPNQSKKPNWFKKLWKKIKDWMKSLSPSDHPETEGIIIVKQDPEIKYLVSNSELGFTPDTLEEDETPSDAAQRSVTEKTALKPKDLKLVPNFSKEAVIESTDPEGNPETKNVNYQLAEISPESEVPKDSKWLTPNEALEQFPEMKPVITACNQQLADPKKSSLPEYDMKLKPTGMHDTPLEHWYKDAEDKKLLWRVVERRQKRVMVNVDDYSFLMDKNGLNNMPKHNPCCKPIVVTAVISIATTIIAAAAVAALLYFFPDMFSNLWTGIVEAVSSAAAGVTKFFGYVFEQLKAAAQFIWTKISSIF